MSRISACFRHSALTYEPVQLTNREIWGVAQQVRGQLGDPLNRRLELAGVEERAGRFEVNGIRYSAIWDFDHDVRNARDEEVLGVTEYHDATPLHVLVSINGPRLNSSENLLRSTIAHELGHVALGHTRQRMIDFTGHSVMRLAFASVLGRILPGIGAHLAGFLSKLLAARLSRRDEYAADAWATALLIKAGIGASGQKSLLTKLEQQSAQRDGPAAWLMSHPGAGQRIAAIEANERRWCPGEPGEPTV